MAVNADCEPHVIDAIVRGFLSGASADALNTEETLRAILGEG